MKIICSWNNGNCNDINFKDFFTIIVKLREREGQGVDRKVTHSQVIYGWWMVDGGYPFPDALH